MSNVVIQQKKSQASDDGHINLLAPELFFNFSTPVYKMWIIQEPNTLEL